MTSNRARVLVAEDEETDWLLLGMAFKLAGIPVELLWARDGLEVIRRLEAEHKPGGASDSPPLRLLLLDLKMPRLTGFEVLEWRQGQKQLSDLAVVVFSSSANPQDMEKSKGLGAREYLVKPTGFNQLMECVKSLAQRYALAEMSGPQPPR